MLGCVTTPNSLAQPSGYCALLIIHRLQFCSNGDLLVGVVNEWLATLPLGFSKYRHYSYVRHIIFFEVHFARITVFAEYYHSHAKMHALFWLISCTTFLLYKANIFSTYLSLSLTLRYQFSRKVKFLQTQAPCFFKLLGACSKVPINHFIACGIFCSGLDVSRRRSSDRMGVLPS